MENSLSSPIASIIQIGDSSVGWYVTLQHPGREPVRVQMTTNQLIHRHLFRRRFIEAIAAAPELPDNKADWEKYLNAPLSSSERFTVASTLEEKEVLFHKLYPYIPLPRKRNQRPWY